MQLYYSKGACSLSTHIVINELDLDCDFIEVNLATKKIFSGEDFYKVNSKGTVPTLKLDNGELLNENLVIQLYLVDTFGGGTLCAPIGDIKRYHVLEWLSYAASDLHKSFTPFFKFKDAEPDFLKPFADILKKNLNNIENQLKNHDYIAGDHFTLPDAYIFVTLRWLRVTPFSLSDWPHFTKYFNRIKERQAVVKAMTQEGLLVK